MRVPIATLTIQVATLVATLVATRSVHGVRTRALLVAMLVAMLVATRSVDGVGPKPSTTFYPDRDTRHIETFDFGAWNIDLAVGPDTALEFFDQICEQEPDSDGYVSGAYNPSINEFKTWINYLKIAAENHSPNDIYAAHGQWHTFRGKCIWNQYKTYVENGATTEGHHFLNRHLTRPDKHRVRMDYPDPGFEARTSIPSWVEKCKDRQLIAGLFESLRGLEQVITVWESLRHLEPQMMVVEEQHSFRRCSEFFYTVTRVVRAVRMNRVLFISGWFYMDGNHGVAGKGWMGLGVEFEYVTSLGAWIDGLGLQRQRPDPASYLHIQRHDLDLPLEQCHDTIQSRTSIRPAIRPRPTKRPRVRPVRPGRPGRQPKRPRPT
jgi:hypothetical protein